jgi:hypothetical protein
MRIQFNKIDKNAFSFSVDGDEIGDIYRTIDEYGKDNWTAVDSLDGLSVTGETMLKAVENLVIQKSLDEYQEELSQDLFG